MNIDFPLIAPRMRKQVAINEKKLKLDQVFKLLAEISSKRL